MAVIAFLEIEGGELKKSSQEVAAYASALAKQVGEEGVGVVAEDVSSVPSFGLSKVVKVSSCTDAKACAEALAKIAEEQSASLVVLPHSTFAESVSAILSIKLEASAVTNVIGFPETAGSFVVKKGIYSGKAFTKVTLNGAKKVLTLKKNSFGVGEAGADLTVEANGATGSADSRITVTGEEKAQGDILLPEADLVVSAGRGLKGPENWGMVEDLAKVLGAATACSKPVSDADWRPHHEHVGQTGVKISPNLYIAIGISGSIQHLAGVSSSKTIVVINTDPEAPFFKAADYGIIGDAFEVVPRLVEALK